MLKIVIKNEYGSFEMGGGSHKNAQILETSGFGLPAKEMQSVTFSGQAGITPTSVRDLERTLTISLSFFGGQRDVERLYRILYREADIYCTFGTRRRKIHGICINPEEAAKIIYREWYTVVLQFVCPDPYFHDFENTSVAISKREDKFPNLYEDGEWKIQLSAPATVRTSEAAIINAGEVDIRPAIYIYNSAPVNTLSGAYGIVITNATTGKSISIDYNVADGETVTVDLAHRRITSDKSGDITNYISDDTVLGDFVLIPGVNDITAVNLNAAADITMTMEYTNNYTSAVI